MLTSRRRRLMAFLFAIPAIMVRGESVRKPISRELLDSTWSRARNHVFRATWAANPMLLALDYTFEDIRNRIFVLDPAVSKEFALDTVNRAKLGGFYVPATDEIFVSETADPDTLERILLHEVVHAFQYRYRYPFDIAYLMYISKRQIVWDAWRLKPPRSEELPALLDYFYESQAHWYSLTLGNNWQWNQYWNKLLDHQRFLDSPIVYGASKLIKFPLFIVSAPVCTLKMWITGEPDWYYQKGYPMWDTALETEQAYALPEILPTRYSYIAWVLHARWTGLPAIKLQNRYLKQLVKVYFGDQKYVFDSRKTSGVVFSLLDANFATNFYNDSMPKTIERMRKRLHDSNTPPAKLWLQPGALEDVVSQSSALEEGVQKFHQLEIKNPVHSIFRNRVRPGIEGTRGDDDIDVESEILPQLEVSP